MEFITHSVEETEKLAEQLIEQTLGESGTSGTATIFALSGDLGAGKTAFTKGIAKALGITDVVTSPTFVLMKIYDLFHEHAAYEKFSRLVHIDCYRLEGAEELVAIGWNTFATDPRNIIFLEWPEKSALAIPQRAHEIEIEVIDEHTRKFTLPDF